MKDEYNKLRHELIDCCERYPKLIKAGKFTVAQANWAIQKLIDKIKNLTLANQENESSVQ